MRQVIFSEFNRSKKPIALGLLGGVFTLVMTIFIAIFRDNTTPFITFISLGGVSLGLLSMAFLYHMVFSMGALNSLWSTKNDYIRSSPISPQTRIIGMIFYHLITGVFFISSLAIISMVYASAISSFNVVGESIKYISDILKGLLALAALLLMLYGVSWGASSFARRCNLNPVVAMVVAVFGAFTLLSSIQWLRTDSWYFVVYSNNGLNLETMIMLVFMGLIGLLTAVMFFDPFEATTPASRKRYTPVFAALIIIPVALVAASGLIRGLVTNARYGPTVTQNIVMDKPATEIVFDAEKKHMRGGPSSAVKVTLVPGNSTLAIIGSEWAQDQFTVNQKGGRLEITQKEFLPTDIECEIRIGVGTLKSLKQNIYANIKSEGVVDCDTLELISTGVGDINFKISSAKSVSVINDGVGKITIEGKTDVLDVEQDGVGSVLLKNLEAKNVTVHSDGVGSCEVWATDTLDADLTGVGSILYSGDPVVTKNVDGVGAIRQIR